MLPGAEMIAHAVHARPEVVMRGRFLRRECRALGAS